MSFILSAKNASEEYNRLSGIINRNLFPLRLKSQIRVPARWLLVRILSSQAGFSLCPHTGWGVGKEIEEKTQRHREFSGVFLPEDTKPIG